MRCGARRFFAWAALSFAACVEVRTSPLQMDAGHVDAPSSDVAEEREPARTDITHGDATSIDVAPDQETPPMDAGLVEVLDDAVEPGDTFVRSDASTRDVPTTDLTSTDLLPFEDGGADVPNDRLDSGPSALDVPPPDGFVDTPPPTFDIPALPDLPTLTDLAPPADRPPAIYTARSIAVGGASSCAVTPSGSIVCWGKNTLNKLNLGLNEYGRDQLVPRVVPGVSNVVSVHLGDDFACALLMGGRIRCWGANNYGQRGAGRVTEITSTPDVTTSEVVDVTTATALTGGDAHACILDAGNVRCWGNNDRMQCGSTSDPVVVAPRTIAGLPRVTALASGPGHVCALGVEGEVFCWGDNRNGQIGAPSPQSSATPLRVPLPERAIEIVTGENFSCARMESRNVYCWGPAAQTGSGNGGGGILPPTRVPGVSMVSSLAAGHRLAVAVIPSGVLAWGWHSFRELGLPEGTPPLLTSPTRIPLDVGEQVAIAYGYVCARDSGGAVRCAGTNDRGQLGSGDSTGYSIAPIGLAASSARLDYAPGSSQMCVADTADTVTCYVQDSLAGTRVVSVSPPGRTRTIATGSDFACALSEAGTVSCWGNNIDGQLGNGASSNSTTPVSVSGLAGVSHLSANLHTACARAADGVYCWGANYQGNVDPRRTEVIVRSPVRVITSATIEGVSVGLYHACAWSGVTVMCWGQNSSGQIAFEPRATRVGPSAYTAPTRVRAVSTGDAHTCALLTDGSSTCWGANEEGQLGVFRRSNAELPSTVQTVSAVDEMCAGASYTCARAAGSVSCWGRGTSGQLGDGESRTSLAAVSAVGLVTAMSIRCGPSLVCARLADFTLRCWGTNIFRLFGPAYVPSYRSVLGF